MSFNICQFIIFYSEKGKSYGEIIATLNENCVGDVDIIRRYRFGD